MTMNETVILVLAGSAGVLLGVIFFGGLWWTVRKGFVQTAGALVLRQPAAANEHCHSGWILCFSGGHWERLLACLLGFVIARLL
jgi:F1F0 ATPase subunit 2